MKNGPFGAAFLEIDLIEGMNPKWDLLSAFEDLVVADEITYRRVLPSIAASSSDEPPRNLAGADEITYRRVLPFDRGEQLGRAAKRSRAS